jgi:hypothetical protein
MNKWMTKNESESIESIDGMAERYWSLLYHRDIGHDLGGQKSMIKSHIKLIRLPDHGRGFTNESRPKKSIVEGYQLPSLETATATQLV